MAEAGLGLGTNLGDRVGRLSAALQDLTKAEGVRLIAVSSLWETPPWGVEDQPDFLNACVLIKTSLAPLELLALCQAIETAHGRERSVRWGPRTLDVDVLFYEGVESAEERLILPHPRMVERAFVLAPLAEIAPERVIAGETVAAHLERVGTDGLTRMCAFPISE